MLPFNINRCACCARPTVRYTLHRLGEETREWVEKPSIDELADVAFQVSMLLYIVTGIVIYIPPSRLTMEKSERRFLETGCVRSARNSCKGA